MEGQGCMFLCFSVCVSLLVCKFSPSLLCNLQPSIGALSGAGHMDASFSPPSLLLLSSFATSFNFCTPNLYFLSSFSSPPSHPIFPSLQFSMSRDGFFNYCTPLPLFSPIFTISTSSGPAVFKPFFTFNFFFPSSHSLFQTAPYLLDRNMHYQRNKTYKESYFWLPENNCLPGHVI